MQTRYQRILWRTNPDEAMRTYELTTVTYGTASAPYLATRSLKQLALDESNEFPLASQVVLHDFYVDDALTGSDNIEEVILIKHQLIQLLQKGLFKAHKWCSNTPALLADLPESDLEVLRKDEHSVNNSIKTLGLAWQPEVDIFHFNVQPLSNQELFTKRSILSNVARLYDPLGLLAPTIIIPKMLIQNLWKEKLEWDAKISDPDKTTWVKIAEGLHFLNDIQIQRRVMLTNSTRIELHGFADSSQNAYGACIYIKCVNEFEVSVSLLCSKSRVAPLKTLSIARLELCAAVLLSQLTIKVIESFKVQ